MASEGRGNKEIIDKASQDMTKWQLVDQVGNVFNRLVIFNSFNYPYESRILWNRQK